MDSTRVMGVSRKPAAQTASLNICIDRHSTIDSSWRDMYLARFTSKALVGALVAACAPYSVAAGEAAAAIRSDALEAIIVTASKRSEKVQDLPASVFVATDERLSRTDVRDFDDLVRIAPSLTITKTTQPANNSINIRGVGTYAFSIATKPSVSVIVDEVTQSVQAQAFQALADVAQVEILRGPQSALFGTSASAGVINITTKGPSSIFEAGSKIIATDDGEERLRIERRLMP